MSINKFTGAIRNAGSSQQVTFGVGSQYQWDEAPDGFGIPAPEFEDSNLPADGVFPGMDKLRRRIIRIPIVMAVGANTETQLDVLKSAWRPSQIDKELDVRFDAAGRRYFGRARGLDVDVDYISQGVIRAVATFEAFDPYGYALTTTAVNSSGSSVFVSNPGTAPTNRCVLTIVGNGGKPLLQNVDDPQGGLIRFRENLMGSVTVDLRTFEVKQGSTARGSFLSPQTTFFPILPIGSNRITFSGCLSVSASVRPAYL